MTVSDFQVARERMVREQLLANGIRDRSVLAAMFRIPRHRFLDETAGSEAYSPHAFPIGFSQTMSQPFMVAYLSEALRLRPTHTVLEVGTGSGYQAAVLSRLAAHVHTVERIEALASRAKRHLAALDITNVHVKASDGAIGWRDQGPFDRVLLTAAACEIPMQLLDQIRDGGLLVAPVQVEAKGQQLIRMTREGDRFEIETLRDCTFVPLVRGTADPEVPAGTKR